MAKLLFALLPIAMWPVMAFAQTMTDKIEELRGQGYSVTSITPVFSQIVSFAMPSGFVGISENTQDGVYMRESILKGQTLSNWTQMLTLAGFKDFAKNSQLDLVTFSNAYIRQMVNKCGPSSMGGKVADIKIGAYDGLISFMACAKATYSDKSYSEETLFLSIKGDSDYYVILLAERGEPTESTPTFDQPKWINKFNQIKPIKLCPRVPGESFPYLSCTNK